MADESEAHIWGVEIDGGSFITPEVTVTGGAITLETGSTLHIYGREMSFSEGALSGAWADGSPFTFALVMVDEGEEGEFTEIPSSLPSEVIFYKTEL
ncbi:MAG: hypothetical protein AAFN12_00095 [Cyanobacteria bacterium J06560_2]